MIRRNGFDVTRSTVQMNDERLIDQSHTLLDIFNEELAF